MADILMCDCSECDSFLFFILQQATAVCIGTCCFWWVACFFGELAAAKEQEQSTASSILPSPAWLLTKAWPHRLSPLSLYRLLEKVEPLEMCLSQSQWVVQIKNNYCVLHIEWVSFCYTLIVDPGFDINRLNNYSNLVYLWKILPVLNLVEFIHVVCSIMNITTELKSRQHALFSSGWV